MHYSRSICAPNQVSPLGYLGKINRNRNYPIPNILATTKHRKASNIDDINS